MNFRYIESRRHNAVSLDQSIGFDLKWIQKKWDESDFQAILKLWNTKSVFKHGICSVHINLLEKWRHFVSPKTLLCVRFRVRIIFLYSI